MAGLDSNRLGIGNSIKSLIQGVQNPTTNQALLGLVKLGAVYDPGAATQWCEVVYFQGKGGPAGSGGNEVGWRIDEEVTFAVTCGFGPYELDSTAAETNMLAAQDILLPEIRKHFQLPDASNPTNAIPSVYRILVEQPDRSQPVKFPNGHAYKLWTFYITASQQYNILLVQP